MARIRAPADAVEVLRTRAEAHGLSLPGYLSALAEAADPLAGGGDATRLEARVLALEEWRARVEATPGPKPTPAPKLDDDDYEDLDAFID